MHRRRRRQMLFAGLRLSCLVAVVAVSSLMSAHLFGVDRQSADLAEPGLAHRYGKIHAQDRSVRADAQARAFARAQWLHVEKLHSSSHADDPDDGEELSTQATWADSADVVVATDARSSTQPSRVVVGMPHIQPHITVPIIGSESTDTSDTQTTMNNSTDLTNPIKKDRAMRLVSSAENSSTDWKAQYGYIEDIDDGRGYTGGIIGFCSGTGDMLELVEYYTDLNSGNPLADYIPALQRVNGTDSHAGLGAGFEKAWVQAAKDPLFRKAQDHERDRVYFMPAVEQAKKDGLRSLGQFIYYDAMVVHGPGNDSESFGGIRSAALKTVKTPAQGGDEAAYLNAFLNARVKVMKLEEAHEDVSRIETAQRVFLRAGNFDLIGPLNWKVYGDPYSL